MSNVTKVVVSQDFVGKRIDVFLAERYPDYSRKQFQQILQSGNVELNYKKAKKSDKLLYGDVLSFEMPEKQSRQTPVPIKMNLDVFYEDAHVMVVNKPAGLVVHLGNGSYEQTLVDGLLYHTGGSLSDIAGEMRPGIVHRIDKDTSGLLLVAKTNHAHLNLAKQLEAHSVKRRYFAIANGKFSKLEGTLDTFLIRDPKNRIKKKSVALDDVKFMDLPKKRAVTHYTVIENLGKYTYLCLDLETGRTHQIRVHMASIAHPLVGDLLYGKGKKELGVERQMLHAGVLGFEHPNTGKYMEFQSEPPLDFNKVLEKLRKVKL
ncbi:MAG: RluA family pseudouridine synthase [Eubacteriales bacterium]